MIKFKWLPTIQHSFSKENKKTLTAYKEKVWEYTQALRFSCKSKKQHQIYKIHKHHVWHTGSKLWIRQRSNQTNRSTFKKTIIKIYIYTRAERDKREPLGTILMIIKQYTHLLWWRNANQQLQQEKNNT